MIKPPNRLPRKKGYHGIPEQSPSLTSVNAFSNTPFFPVTASNLRGGKKKKKRAQYRGQCGRGMVQKALDKHGKPESRFGEGGSAPLWHRYAHWTDAYKGRTIEKTAFEYLNLCKLRKYLEKGRLDYRYPINQRHLLESRCVRRVRVGVALFNVNDYPFPYKIDIEVASADQSAIDAIRNVGGSVTIVYNDRINLRALVKPFKFEVLPRASRPSLAVVNLLEQMRMRGCLVRYIKPLWLLDEEKRIKTEIAEFEAENDINNESIKKQFSEEK
eukprot:GHVL01014859.1.p1 GENE.GHVL01014859.1~~GHVL01014859.1.p1  ORF type:complete len:295 (+),score=52.41 GHVL01014859.1:70-885(+)